MSSCTIQAVLAGRVKPFGPNGEPSAIRKTPSAGPVMLAPLGLEGDEHAYHGHGGPDKALLQYATEHYRMWKELLPGFDLAGGGFGENVPTSGLTEATVCVGDRYRIGRRAIVELSQPRQPCWKLGYNAGQREIPRLMQEHAAPGWYYRVIEPGPIAPGDRMELLERPLPDWTIERVIRGFYGSPMDEAFLESLVDLHALGAEWRTAAKQRSESGEVEDWQNRLYGPLAAEGG